MTDKVRELMHAVPFAPFVIKSSDGKEYYVKHPDYLAISPKGGRVSVFADSEVDTMLTALHIVAVERRPRGLAKPRRSR
jgi:hypothetical protein